jgi:Flp pilus assembly protein TadG
VALTAGLLSFSESRSPGLKESVSVIKHLQLPHFLRRENGISLAEFALILPVFLAILLGMVDLGHGFNTYLGMLNATREGAFWFARNGADESGMNVRIASELDRVGLTPDEVTVTLVPVKTSYEEGDIVTLTIEYSYELLFGALTGLPSLTLHTQHTMVVMQ